MATAASTHSVPVRSREETITHIADRVSYWLISAGIYFTFGLLFYYSAKEKLIDNGGTMPAGLAKTRPLPPFDDAECIYFPLPTAHFPRIRWPPGRD